MNLNKVVIYFLGIYFVLLVLSVDGLAYVITKDLLAQQLWFFACISGGFVILLSSVLVFVLLYVWKNYNNQH